MVVLGGSLFSIFCPGNISAPCSPRTNILRHRGIDALYTVATDGIGTSRVIDEKFLARECGRGLHRRKISWHENFGRGFASLFFISNSFRSCISTFGISHLGTSGNAVFTEYGDVDFRSGDCPVWPHRFTPACRGNHDRPLMIQLGSGLLRI